MATADSLPLDPLSLLRAAVAAKTLPIPSTTPDPSAQHDTDVSLAEANYLIFNPTRDADTNADSQHISIPLTQPTRFLSPDNGNRPIDLRSVFVCWLNRNNDIAGYNAEKDRLNHELMQAEKKEEPVIFLRLVERVGLNEWLEGNVPEEGGNEYIRSRHVNKQSRAEAAAAAKEVAGLGEDVEMADADGQAEAERLREILAAERQLADRNTVLRGIKVQDFSDVRKKYSPLFFAKSKAAAAQQQQHTTNGHLTSTTTPGLTTNPALRPPILKPGQPLSASGHRRAPEPIILLSPSASSLLRMPNIKSFLSDGLYTLPDSTASSTAPNILHLQRALPSIQSANSTTTTTTTTTKPMRFILLDDPSTFRPDYWSRLVAVFTTGQTWQFKNYKWQSPAELFSHALGVYVGWKGDPVPETVKGWGRGVLTVQIDKGTQRWRDREVVEDIWRGIEGRMKAMGWGKEGGR